METYRVRLQREGEDYAAYEVGGISADTPVEAAESAKRFIADNGWWPSRMNVEERMKRLSAVSIRIDTV